MVSWLCHFWAGVRQDLLVDSQVEQHCSLCDSREHAFSLPLLVHHGPQIMGWCHHIQGVLTNQLWKHLTDISSRVL